MELDVGGRRLQTGFAIPGGRAADVLARLDAQALGLARARVAARLGDPDPFHVRTALAAAPDAHIAGCDGRPLTPDVVDAALVAAGHVPELAGLFAGRPPGPAVRAVPVDDAARAYLRWHAEVAQDPAIGPVQSWSAAEIGDAAVATIRCAEPLPGGGVALGSDYGLTLWRGGRFEPFPWPRGSRREARRVEALAVHDGKLHVGTTQTLYVWDFRGGVTSRRHGADHDDGYDDLVSMLSVRGRLLLGYRTKFEGASGPPDALAMVADPSGVVYAGTRHGELHVVDGGGPIRRFEDHKPRPVRHLAFAAGALWVAAKGELHRFDGASWSRTSPEPTALATDPAGRLWALAEGRLFVLRDGVLAPVPVPLERPWCLAALPGALWIGGRERVWRVEVR